MKIGVNARLLISNKLDGIGWFSYETLTRIVKNNPQHQFVFYFDRKPSINFSLEKNCKAQVVYPSARHPFLWFLWFDVSLPFYLKKHKIDLFISTDGWTSSWYNVKSLNVIHDLNFIHYPQFIKIIPKLYYRIFFKRYAQKATRLATVSEFSKNDIHTQYNIPLHKIDVVYNGCNDLYKPISLAEQQIVKQKYSEGKNYFLFIGTLHARKNVENHLLAFEVFKKQTNSDFKFLFIGQKKWWTPNMEDCYNSLSSKNDIAFLNRQDVDTTHQLLASAYCLLYVSHFEGFGIPMLEAFNCHVPVVAGNNSSMPEIAGDAAIYADANDYNAISNCMQQVVSDSKLKASLIEAGIIQSKKYSWDITANKLQNAIEKIIAL